jgi:hypothetical protein
MLAVAHRQVEPVAELLEVRELELLHLVGGVLALEGLDRPALDGVARITVGWPTCFDAASKAAYTLR